jgi:peptide/nickel transport system permease protein
MLKYIFKRVFIFIPTLFAISLIAFVISINAPGDPVDSLFTGGQGNSENASLQTENMLQQKNVLRHQLGLDLPVFYFTLSNIATPDTLYKVFDKNRLSSLERLIDTYGNWNEISKWYISLETMRDALKNVNPDSVAYTKLGHETADKELDDARQEIASMLVSYEDVVITNKLNKMEKMVTQNNSLGQHNFLVAISKPLSGSKQAFELLKNNSSSWKNWIPSLKFYGYNQYHRWLFGDGNWLTGNGAEDTRGVIRGDFGKSYATKQAVTKTITRAIPWSLLFTIFSVFLAYLISIPIGVRSAAKRGSIFDRTSSVVLFMLYSLPVFFMATLLMLAFANPEVYNIFPSNGVKPATGYPDGISLWEKFKITLPYLVLPLICYTYASFAFLSRTMRVAMLEIISQDYIRTAKAKGLSNFLVIYKHGLKNALLPIITVFASIFPQAVGGAVIIEFIFGIPGMGQEIYQAVLTKDYPMIVCVFTLTGFLTLVGYLVSDILYAITDPRISYSKR